MPHHRPQYRRRPKPIARARKPRSSMSLLALAVAAVPSSGLFAGLTRNSHRGRLFCQSYISWQPMLGFAADNHDSPLKLPASPPCHTEQRPHSCCSAVLAVPCCMPYRAACRAACRVALHSQAPPQPNYLYCALGRFRIGVFGFGNFGFWTGIFGLCNLDRPTFLLHFAKRGPTVGITPTLCYAVGRQYHWTRMRYTFRRFRARHM